MTESTHMLIVIVSLVFILLGSSLSLKDGIHSLISQNSAVSQIKGNSEKMSFCICCRKNISDVFL